jgi:purine-binding chemotaxis protein CheW
MTSSATEPTSEFLTFFVEAEEYAVPLGRVREVIPFEQVTRVPKMAPALRGVTSLRGQVVPVVDLRTKFHGKETDVGKRTCIVLVETVLDGAPVTLGLLTEAVGQVLALGAADVVPPPELATPVRAEFLDGLGRIDGRFALLLRLDRLLDRIELLSPALAGREEAV